MNTITSVDFSELYRRAFAESDPKKKVLLLHEVQRAICEWEQSDYGIKKDNEHEPKRNLQRAAS
ncbi:MAG TPA: hypothetical protein VEV41_24945 [Terriglobales bacterium]|nr:hypothetical protein [Terriglobales bacterium]